MKDDTGSVLVQVVGLVNDPGRVPHVVGDGA